MSGFREEFKFVFDVVGNKQATKAFADVGKAADKAGAQTEAGVGKATKSFGSFAKNAAPIAGAMATIATAAFAAVGKFEKLGIAVGRFSDATKLSTQDSSRWIEIAGDIGISAESVQGAIGKMEKALATSPGKFEALGVAIAHTSDGAVDVQRTFLNAIDAVNATRDPLARSKVASELFGKSWQSMSELIGMGSDKIKTALGSVDASKVLSPEEVAKAKAYREAMDKLHDAFEELVLTVGEELIPALTTVANTLSTIAKVGVPAAKHVSELVSAASGGKADGLHRAATDILMFGTPEVTRGLRKVAGLFKSDIKGSIDLSGGAARDFVAEAWKMRDAGIANAAAWEVQARKHDLLVASQLRGNHAQEEFNATMAVTAEETRKAAAATRILDDQWSALMGTLDNQRAANDAIETAKELAKAARTGKITTAQKLDNKSTMAQNFHNLGVSNRTIELTILPALDMGMYEHVAALLDALTRFRVAPFEPRLTTTKLGDKTAYATGGNIGTKGGIVGDAGPEYFQPASAGRIFTSGELARAVSGGGSSGGGNTYQIAVTVGAGANPAEVGRQTVEAIKQYERMAGSGWRN